MKKICVFAIALIAMVCSFSASAETVTDPVIKELMVGMKQGGDFSSITFNGKNVVLVEKDNSPELEAGIAMLGADTLSSMMKAEFLKGMAAEKNNDLRTTFKYMKEKGYGIEMRIVAGKQVVSTIITGAELYNSVL